MLNKETKKTKKVKMTKDHKKALKILYLVAFSIVALGFLLSGLTWADIIPSGI